MTSLDDVRSLLFLPATRDDRFDRAAASGTDAVILDLEDSVAPQDKHRARDAAGRWLAGRASDATPAVVRVNGVGTPWHDDDLAMVAAAGCPVLLPKADDVARLRAVRDRLPAGSPLLALVETARGVRDVAQLCTSGAVDQIAFGSVDFAVELGIDPVAASITLDHARAALVVAAAAAGLPAPWDGVTTAVRDGHRLSADVVAAVSAGFGGKLAIHPSQVAVINDAWSPRPEEVEWARRVVGAINDAGEIGVVVVDGHMADAPVVARARRLLHRAELRRPHDDASSPTGSTPLLAGTA